MCDPSFDREKFFRRLYGLLSDSDLEISALLLEESDKRCDHQSNMLLDITQPVAAGIQESLTRVGIALLLLVGPEEMKELTEARNQRFKEMTGKTIDDLKIHPDRRN